jgi:hypothetical protein
MAVVQSTYRYRMSRALAGLWADMQDYNSITRSCRTEDGIGFGLAVGRDDTYGNTPNGGAKLGGAIDEFLGVSLRDITQEVTPTLPVDKYAFKWNMGILTYGTVWVQVTGTPGADDPVHFNATTGVFGASGGTGPILGARWVSGTEDGLCKLFLAAYGQAT